MSEAKKNLQHIENLSKVLFIATKKNGETVTKEIRFANDFSVWGNDSIMISNDNETTLITDIKSYKVIRTTIDEVFKTYEEV